MIGKTFIAAFVVAGLAGSGAMAAPSKRTDQRAATRALNEQQLAMATNVNGPSAASPGMTAPAMDPATAAPAGQVAPPAGESAMPMATPTDPAAPAMTEPTEAAPSPVPPQ